MEAADEEAGIEQPIAAMTGGFAQRLPERLVGAALRCDRGASGDAECEHRHQGDAAGERDEGEAVAEFAEQ